MLLAAEPPTWVFLIPIAVMLAMVVGLLFLVRWYNSSAEAALQACYEGLRLHAAPEQGDVLVEYHTYHGIIAYFVQTPHRAILPAHDARTLLARLLWFNLTRGLVNVAVLFSVPLSLLNYWLQLRSIDRQETDPASGPLAAFSAAERAVEFKVAAASPGDLSAAGEANPYTPPAVYDATASQQGSTFHLVIGTILMLLAVLFGVTSIYMVIWKQEWAALFGGGLAVFACGGIGYQFIQKGRGVDSI